MSRETKHAARDGGDQERKTKGRRGGHRKGNEPFLMLTQTMAQDRKLYYGNLTKPALAAVQVFYRAHIEADAQGKDSFPMKRKWLMTLLKVSKRTVERIIVELLAAKVIVTAGKRKLHGASFLPAGSA
jgi:hypothetical protein